MNLTSEDYERIVRENGLEISRLQSKVEKLAHELSKELSENVLQSKQVLDHQKSLNESRNLYHHLLQYHQSIQDSYMIKAEKVNNIIYILNEDARFIYANDKATDFFGKSIDAMIGQTIKEIEFDDTSGDFLTRIYESVIFARTKQTTHGSILLNNEFVNIEMKAEPVIDDAGDIIGVIHTLHQGVSEKEIKDFYQIETILNTLSRTETDPENIIQKFFNGISQLAFFEAGFLSLINPVTQKLETRYLHDSSGKIIPCFNSFHGHQNFHQLMNTGHALCEMEKYLPQSILVDIKSKNVNSAAFFPLQFNNMSIGVLNICSSETKAFTTHRKILLERSVTHLANILVLHQTNDKLEDTILKLNETISDLKKNQQLLIQKSKMESLGVLSAGMAHEINQPLQIISLSAENIADKMENPENRFSLEYLRKKLDTIMVNVQRIRQVVEKLRLFSREKPGILIDRFSVKEVLNNTLAMVHSQVERDQIKISISGFDENLYVLGNIYSLEQVFINLLLNSIFAVNEREKKQSNTRFTKHISIEAHLIDDDIIMRFCDNGIGISEDIRDKVFMPFFTTKKNGNGMGLGLPIAYGIMKEMNGNIKIESDPGNQTVIEIRCPAV